MTVDFRFSIGERVWSRIYKKEGVVKSVGWNGGRKSVGCVGQDSRTFGGDEDEFVPINDAVLDELRAAERMVEYAKERLAQPAGEPK